MATTTPNYGWPVPTSTDYVKDGAVAIEALGDAIDATVFALPAGGLSLLIPTSVTKGASGTASVSATGVVTLAGTESISINSCFSATYNNYRVIVNLTGSTTTPLRARMKTGSDDTGAVYDLQRGEFSSTSVTGVRNSNNTTIILTNTDQDSFRGNFEFLAPNLAANTGFTTEAITTNAGLTSLAFSATRVETTTQYTGFSVIPDAGTISGTIAVYGYKI